MFTTRQGKTAGPFLFLATAGFGIAVLFAPVGSAGSGEAFGEQERQSEASAEARPLVEATRGLACDLYRQVAGRNPSSNQFFSPYSIYTALAMAAEGARSETAEQMGQILRFPVIARRTGDDTRLIPWDTSRIHTALAALNEQVLAGARPVPDEVRTRIETLRRKLDAANRRAAEMQSKDMDAYFAAARQSQALANELNELLTRYEQYELRVANALWGERSYPFRRAYLDTLKQYYHTALYPLDFRTDAAAARQKINAWVVEQTRNRIKDLVGTGNLDNDTRLVLTNAVYFKGEWAEVFQPGQTRDDDFLLASGAKVRVPMMHRDDMPFASYAAFRGDGTCFNTPMRVTPGESDPRKLYPDDRGFTMLELPYKGDAVAMVLLVPRSADGLAHLEKQMTGDGLRAWLGKLEPRPQVHVFLPRFNLETKYDLGQALAGMGMARAFRDPRLPDGAQFDGMTEGQDPAHKLFLSRVLHRAFVEVHEKGTEAAAATAVIATVGAPPPEMVPFTPTFRADRPFVLLIRHRQTGTVLFLGRVTNPRDRP